MRGRIYCSWSRRHPVGCRPAERSRADGPCGLAGAIQPAARALCQRANGWRDTRRGRPRRVSRVCRGAVHAQCRQRADGVRRRVTTAGLRTPRAATSSRAAARESPLNKGKLRTAACPQPGRWWWNRDIVGRRPRLWWQTGGCRRASGAASHRPSRGRHDPSTLTSRESMASFAMSLHRA